MSTLCWTNTQKEGHVAGQYASSYLPNVSATTQHYNFHHVGRLPKEPHAEYKAWPYLGNVLRTGNYVFKRY